MNDLKARLQQIEAEKEFLLQAEREQRKLAEALREAGAALSSTLNYNEVLDRILDQISRVVPHDAANIMLINNDYARVVRGHGYSQFGTKDSLTAISFKVSDVAALQKMRETSEPLAIPNVQEDSTWVYAKPEHAWIQSYAGVPLCIREQVIGFLNVNSATPHFFSLEDAERLQTFADHAAIAIENARLYYDLQQHRDHLEEMIEARTTALTKTNERLQQEIRHRQEAQRAMHQFTVELAERNEELDSFAHTVAHDLKSPVNIIIGYSEILEDSFADMSEVDVVKILKIVGQAGIKMNSIINELLLLSSVRKQDIKVHPLRMVTIVEEAQKRLIQQIQEYDANIIMPKTWPKALGYAPWIEEVWANYIGNAIKYGGRPPQIMLGSTEHQNGMVTFWVKDNGQGITPEDQARLFAPFERLEQARVKGHGLGLSVVRRIVEKLNGQVSVESELGQGSIFAFTLPALTNEQTVKGS